MEEFIYHEPTTVKEATFLLKEFKGDAKIKAGGTEFLVNMKKGMIRPKHLINLKNIAELTYIDYLPEVGLKIGALTSLSEIESSVIIRDKCSILYQAASKVASPQIRNRATLGGNICLDSMCQYYNRSRQWLSSLDPCYKRRGNCCYVLENGRKCYSVFSADTVPALIVLGARVKLVNFEQERVLPLEDLYTGVGMKVNKIQPDEILTEIQMSEVDERALAVYLKISERGEVDFAILGIAVLILSGEDETFEKVDVVVIGTGPSPVRLSKIGEMLKGQKIESEVIDRACKDILAMVRPISNAFGLAEYKSKLLPSLIAQGIREAAFSEGTMR